MKKIVKKVSEIADGVKNKITGKQEEMAKNRMAICLQCKDRKSSSFMPDRCGVCGCILEYKTRSPKSSCPNGLWVLLLFSCLSLLSCNKKAAYDTVVVQDTIRHVRDIVIPKDSVVLIQRISELKDTVVYKERVVLATKIVNDAIVIQAECPEVVVKDTAYIITSKEVLVPRVERSSFDRLLLFLIIVIIIVMLIKQVFK